MATIDSIPLSNDEKEVIDRPLPSGTSKTPAESLFEVYEIERTIYEIEKNAFKRIALQFPDDLLTDAAAVTASLQKSCKESSFYVLGDTSYGSCCADEVAAEHVDADVLIHYGRSCLSPTSKLPVIYVFGKLPLDVASFVDKVCETIPTRDLPLLLVSDTTYMSSQKGIANALGLAGYRQVISSSLRSLEKEVVETNERIQYTLPGRQYEMPEGIELLETTMIYIGPPSPTLTTTLMTHSSLVSRTLSYHPKTQTLVEETSQNTALRRRYATVQKARDAAVIGIVVGTLGVRRYMDLIKHLKHMISQSGKKSYLFAMGKLNPSKMANFSEIDAFVLVACGENSLVESRDFYKPVVTPFELSLALRTGPHDAVPWTGDWVTDFERVLTMPVSETDNSQADAERDAEAPHFSLVTGKYSSSSKPMFAALNTADDSNSALATRSSATALSMVGGLFSPAAQHLKQRAHWSGLGSDHVTTGSDDEEAATVTRGRSGIARGYDDYRPTS